IKSGYEGLLNKNFEPLNIRSVSGIINRGGTFLHTARSKEFMTEEGQNKAVKNCIEEGIEGLIVIGGDGSFRGARALSLKGIRCIGVPGTIDNDIACSDYTIGFDTAMNTAMDMVDKLRDTAQSHQRCSIVEVMGRDAGYIALNTGIACGATAILLPEYEVDIKRDVIDRIYSNMKLGRRHFIVVVAEGVGKTKDIFDEVSKNIDIDVRVTILGHVQRGGSPTLLDRVNASKLGHEAVKLLIAGEYNKVVAINKMDVVSYDIMEALSMKKTIDKETVDLAHELSI
ncbi:MAG: ATP-dependent 6-phosphofructokinase, partial [Oscillospiraceae bacterium]